MCQFAFDYRQVILSLLAVLLIQYLGHQDLQAAIDTNHPGHAIGQATEVAVSVFILDLDGIDSQSQSFEANVFILAHWQDERLKHKHDGVVKKSAGDVWTPHLQILNQQKVFTTLPDIVRITPEGAVSWRQRYWGSFSQPLDLRTFPFDDQTIKVQVVAATGEQGKDITYKISDKFPSDLSDELSIADWRVMQHQAGPVELTLTKTLPKVKAFELSVSMQRNIGYYIVKVLIPLVLIVAMSWIVFWIDPTEAGTQISVAITTMLTLIAYRFAVDSSLPNVSYLTSLDYFIMLATILVYVSLIEVLITAKLAKNEATIPKARRMDGICRWLFPAAFLCIAAESLFLRFII